LKSGSRRIARDLKTAYYPYYPGFQAASKREAARSASAIKACKPHFAVQLGLQFPGVSCISTSHWAVLGMSSKCAGMPLERCWRVWGWQLNCFQPDWTSRGHLGSSRFCRLKYRLVRINKKTLCPAPTA